MKGEVPSKDVSRNAGMRVNQVSLVTPMGMANLSEKTKPSNYNEAAGESSCSGPRGYNGQRASKDVTGVLRDPGTMKYVT